MVIIVISIPMVISGTKKRSNYNFIDNCKNSDMIILLEETNARIKKLELDEWDNELREMTAADSGTALEQGIMRMFATPEISKV